jgi:hypothetical protein
MVVYRLYKINILLFSIFLISVPVRSETRFNSAKLREIYLLLPDHFRHQIDKLDSKSMKSYVLDASGIVSNQSISVRYNKDNQLVHLGLHLIFNKPEDDRFQVVYDYVERTLLNFALLTDKERITRKMSEEQLQIKCNKKSLPVNQIISTLSSTCFSMETKFRLDSSEDSFLVSWQLPNSVLFQIGFPNDYPVICGMTKDEIEQEIVEELQNESVQSSLSAPVTQGPLESSPDGLFIKKGKVFFDHLDINSDSYFVQNSSGEYLPVFSQKFYKESAANVFQNLIDTNQKISLTLKLYGNREERCTLDLNRFLNYFSENYTTYFGWQRVDSKNDLVASVFVRNHLFSFIHMLIVKTNSNLILNKDSTIEGTLYIFIPQKNISL